MAKAPSKTVKAVKKSAPQSAKKPVRKPPAPKPSAKSAVRPAPKPAKAKLSAAKKPSPKKAAKAVKAAAKPRAATGVTLLSKTLTQDLSDMQSDIHQDLSSALANPSLESVQHALGAADARLSESEAAQTEAFARINHHISELATIVESRLTEESEARERAMAEMEINDTIRSKDMELSQFRRAVERRLEALESDARAVESRIDRAVAPITSRIEGLEYGITSAAPIAAAAAAISDAAPLPLAPPLGAADVYSAESTGNDNHYEQAQAVQTEPAYGAAEQGYATPQPAYAEAPHQTSSPDAFSPDAFSPAPDQASIPVAAPAAAGMAASPAAAPGLAVPYNPANYAAPEAPAAPVASQIAPQTAELPMPQAYTPESYAPAAYTSEAYASEAYGAAYGGTPNHGPNPYAPQIPPEHQPQPHSQLGVYPQAQYQAPAPVAPPAPHIPAPFEAAAQAEPPHITDAELPYANPAYAEGSRNNEEAPQGAAAEQSMESARPGGLESVKKLGRREKKKKAAKAKAAPAQDNPSSASGLLTPRNMKIGGAVAALGLISILGAQTLIPKTAPGNDTPFMIAKNGAIPPVNITENIEVLPPNGQSGTQRLQGLEGPAAMQDGAAPKPVSHEATIGKYQDNRLSAIAGEPHGNTELAAAAASGHPVAQLQLGLSKIEAGDLDGGVKLVRASANQDQPAALYRLAKLYETGQGVGQDAETARELTERAARGGNRIAMHDLALYFAEGRGGVEIDMPNAAKWFEKAAERGVVDSQFNLGVLFESGQGLPLDEEAALVWYSIAGAQGDQMAAGRVNILRKTLGEEQLSRADKRIAGFNPARIDEPANGIFTNLPWMDKAGAKLAQGSGATEAVRQTQALLGDLGYEVGAADGAIGPKTRNAIKSFERVNGLPETGQVNAELIERLETAAGA